MSSEASADRRGLHFRRDVVIACRIMAAIILIVIGILDLIFPTITGLSAASVAPIFLVIGGFIGVLDGLFGMFHPEGGVNWAEALFGFIYLMLGFVLATHLFAAVFTLAVIVGAGYLAQAIVSVIAVFTNSGHRGWLFCLVLCNGLLAIMSFAQWPFGAMMLVGISVGFALISWGIALLSGGFYTKARFWG